MTRCYTDRIGEVLNWLCYFTRLVAGDCDLVIGGRSIEMNNLTTIVLFVTSIAVGNLLGRAWGAGLVGRRLRDLRDTVDYLKRRWWSTFWHMVRLVEEKEAEDQGDYWKDGRQPPWYA
jgi:hypothetical protein